MTSSDVAIRRHFFLRSPLWDSSQNYSAPCVTDSARQTLAFAPSGHQSAISICSHDFHAIPGEHSILSSPHLPSFRRNFPNLRLPQFPTVSSSELSFTWIQSTRWTRLSPPFTRLTFFPLFYYTDHHYPPLSKKSNTPPPF